MELLHESLGGLLCRSWHLPPVIGAAVSAHHSPERASAPAEPLVRALRAADALAAHLDAGEDPDRVTESAAMLGLPDEI
jgi:HD-like signal output (HDOD) protein